MLIELPSTTWQKQKRKGETKRATAHHKLIWLILEKNNIIFAVAHSCINLSMKSRGMGRNSLASDTVINIREKRTIGYTLSPINQ